MNRTVDLLIVNGSAPEVELVLARFQAAGIQFKKRCVNDRQSFLAALADQTPDLILADYSHPALDGHVALSLAKRFCPEAPFFFLAGESGADLAHKTHALTVVSSDLEQFAFAASHDLQEPLRTVSLFSKLLSSRYKGALDPQADEYLGFIESAAQHMGVLLEQLSVYTQLPIRAEDFEPVDLNEILRHTVSLFEVHISQSNAAITSGELPAVLGTRPQLGLVFQHLIDNALKYHGSDPPLVHVEAAKSDDEWVISVRDNGIGFPQHYAEQVFGLFKRLNKRDFAGAGLGLPICKRIVEVHGGRIWADSQQNSGSTFYFTIPPRESWQKSSLSVV